MSAGLSQSDAGALEGAESRSLLVGRSRPTSAPTLPPLGANERLEVLRAEVAVLEGELPLARELPLERELGVRPDDHGLPGGAAKAGAVTSPLIATNVIDTTAFT